LWQHRNFIPYCVFPLKHSVLRRCTIWTAVFSNHCRVVTRRRDIVRGGADKPLARPTSLCRRTESIVLLERGVCSFAELQVFLVTEPERKHVKRRARFQQHRHASCYHVFFLQGKAPKEIHTILAETLGEHVPSYATVKNWVASLNVVISPPVMRLVLDDPKHLPPRRLLIKFTS